MHTHVIDCLVEFLIHLEVQLQWNARFRMVTKFTSRNMNEVCVDIPQLEAQLIHISSQYQPHVRELEILKYDIYNNTLCKKELSHSLFLPSFFLCLTVISKTLNRNYIAVVKSNSTFS